MKYLFFFIALVLLLNRAYAAENEAGNEAEKYRTCMVLAAQDPPQAVIYANDWIFSGGAVPAGHCKALGLLGTGQAASAAKLLEKLVEDLILNGDPAEATKNAALKIQLYGQAALAWKEAGDLDKAYVAYSSAMTGMGAGDSLLQGLFLARGTLQILRSQYKAAIDDLTFAIEKDDRQFEGFLQRAKAYRKRKYYLKARLDLRVAAKIRENHPGILLESGILFREQGHKTEARQAWRKIIELYPHSEHAMLAQTNLDLSNAESGFE